MGRIAGSLKSAIEGTESYIGSLDKYSEDYDRPGSLFNKTTCYEQIKVTDTFNSAKSGFNPAIAIKIFENDPNLITILDLHTEFDLYMTSLVVARDKYVLSCNSGVNICTECRPANLLTAYRYRENLSLALAVVELQEQVFAKDLKISKLPEKFDIRKKSISCEFIEMVESDIPQYFAPFNIQKSRELCP